MIFKNFLATLQYLLRQHSLRFITLFFAVLLPLITFGSLVAQIRDNGALLWDVSILHLVHDYSTPNRDKLIVFATVLGGVLSLPLITMTALGLRFLHGNKPAVFFTLAVGGAWCLNVVAKVFFHRSRPEYWQSPLPEFDYSFPSGHAMMSMAITAVLVILAWPTRLRWPFLICGSLCVVGVGLSRLYLGVHYPSDIVAGWCAALLWVTGVHFISVRHGYNNHAKSYAVG